MKNRFAKNKKHILITVLAILIISCGLLVGCNNSEKETLSENEVESAATPDATTEPEETAESASITEPEKLAIELSADEYYVDYPLALEDGRQVYVKIPPLVNFYPAEEQYTDITYLDTYASSNYLITKLSADSEASVSYEIDNGDYTFINWCMEWEEESWSYEVSEPENWENGIKAYRIDAVFGGGDKTTQYVLYYPLEDDLLVLIDIDGFLGTPYLLDDGELPEENEKILDFYRTEENLFVVVDPETTDVVVSDTTGVSTLHGTNVEPESTPQPSEEPTSTPTPSEEPDSTPTPTETPTHTHNYTSSTTQPTCTTQGYTTHICACGDSYKDNYISATGHNYQNGTCTICGATDTNYTHQHSWTETYTYEVKIDSACVDFYICRCNNHYYTSDALEEHQNSTGWDGTCNSCGTYYYDGRTTFFVYQNNDPSTDRVVSYLCPNCGGTDFTRNSVHCGGWANSYEYIDYYEGIENDYQVAGYNGAIWEYGYRECACGAREDYQPWTPRSGDFSYEQAFVLDPSTKWWEN